MNEADLVWSPWHVDRDSVRDSRCRRHTVVGGWEIEEIDNGRSSRYSVFARHLPGPVSFSAWSIGEALVRMADVDRQAAELRAGIGISLGQRAQIEHACVGVASAIWTGVGWRCECGEVVFPPVAVVALR